MADIQDFNFDSTFEDTTQYPTGPRSWRTLLMNPLNNIKTWLNGTIKPVINQHNTDIAALKEVSGFEATKTNTMTVDTSWPVVTYNVENYDLANEYDPATGEFTVNKAGYYVVCAGLALPLLPDQTKVILVLAVNGTINKTLAMETISGSQTYEIVGSTTKKLNAGDKISVKIYASVSVTTQGAAGANYFSAAKV